MESNQARYKFMTPSNAQNSINIEIEGALDPDQLLEVLNRSSGNFQAIYAKQHRILDNPTDQNLFPFINAAVKVTIQLRTYVSEWIDTGLDSGSAERPLKRNLKSVPNSTRCAVAEFQVKYPNLVSIIDLGEHGQRMVCKVGWNALLKGTRALPQDPHEAALAWAQSFFVAFLLSPWKHRICRCRRCGGFLLLTRAPKKNGYLHGVNCDACANAASAVAITAGTRKDQYEILKTFAVEECFRLDCKFNPELIKQAARQISDRVTKKLIGLPGTFYKNKRIGKRICSSQWVKTHATDLAKEQRRIEDTRGPLEKRSQRKGLHRSSSPIRSHR